MTPTDHIKAAYEALEEMLKTHEDSKCVALIRSVRARTHARAELSHRDEVMAHLEKQKWITIGKYSLQIHPRNCVSICLKSGEGGMFDMDKLEALLEETVDKFYKEHF